ncbi:UNVERIFIED_CONTAM: hypothetical protein PYX00_007165 [Menopon gallinae]|uniref:Nuclear export mediator factor NEMF n=1 Tax=Menopon gallinae TaxID=328185 RepID=A0AAW2HIM6_9NEOP
MKTRFSTLDLVCSLADLQKYVGLRVQQVYDIDQKTYLIKLQKTDEKIVILLESGTRIHSTDYEWPKNVAPSGFSMKLRKHLKNKRLEHLKQLGIDRVVDLQFGSDEAAYHIFIQLYDKGNIILTDCDYTILYILRHNIAKDVTRSVKGKYPVEEVRKETGPPSEEMLKSILENAKTGDNLKKILNPHFDYGPAIIEHVLLGIGLQGGSKLGKDVTIENHLTQLHTALIEADSIMNEAVSKPMKGYIIQKVEKRPTTDGGFEDCLVNEEFHPYLFRQHANRPYVEFDSFDKAVDSFFSTLEGQNIFMKAIVQEKAAMKKLENVRRDHDQRLKQLEETQEIDRIKAELITKNQVLVDQAIQAIRRALANQMPWPNIETLVKEAASTGDPVASKIKGLKLDINHITLELSDPYSDESEEDDEECLIPNKKKKPGVSVDIDLDLTAFANARKYYDKKRSAAKKQQKTIESQGKALKSAERKVKIALKEMKTIVNINRARKIFWFEKFFWFISSENYLVIAGRDMMQNEIIVKRYMRPGDIYVHADIHGASSVIIKNPSGEPIPPKTLNEAGVMALAYSAAWKAKVLAAAWWVKSDQVSKTAPTGEYITTGSFIIRGKKNYLPPGNLIMGYSFLFKLEENSVFRHRDERKVKTLEEEFNNIKAKEEEEKDEVEIILSDDGEEEEEDDDDDEESPVDKKPEFESALEDIKEEVNDEDNEEAEIEGKVEDRKVEHEGENEDEVEENAEVISSFPDREIKIHHSGKGISLQTEPINQKSEDLEEVVVFLGDDKPVRVKMNQKEKGNKQKNDKQDNKSQKNKETPKMKEEINKQENKTKKGLRGKMKKIKEKYKDQDEEDRQLYLEILQNVVTRKNRKDKKKDNSSEAKTEKKEERKQKTENRTPREKRDDDDGEQIEPAVNVDLEVLNSLTGIPHGEDELLFAVPVVAPYSSLHNYKYKVKITPGTGKRGKAAKTAMQLFMRDKMCTQREKDLMKGVKDEELARNIPGQVKVSGPNLHKK